MRNLTILFSGYGHWKIGTRHYGQLIYTITTNSSAIDDAKDGIKKAISALRKEIISNNKN